jgi:hypothetical protein
VWNRREKILSRIDTGELERGFQAAQEGSKAQNRTFLWNSSHLNFSIDFVIRLGFAFHRITFSEATRNFAKVKTCQGSANGTGELIKLLVQTAREFSDRRSANGRG